jgi:hypothetical protein
MHVFLLSSCLLACAWVIHFALWRVKLPKHHIQALLVIFAAVLGCWVLAAAISARNFAEIVRVCALYISVALSYIITYSAIEGDSPTLSLMRLLASKGAEGLTIEEVDEFVARAPFVAARISALMHSDLVREENGRYFLHGRPSLFFRLILEFRKLYGPISKGG